MATGGGPYKQFHARILLGRGGVAGKIDWATFIEWCKQVNPPVEPLAMEKHPRLLIDSRAKWYSRASLERLAAWRGITLLSDEELLRVSPAAEAEDAQSVVERIELLEQRFDEWQLAVVRREEELRHVLLQEVDRRIQTKLQAFEQRQRTQTVDHPKALSSLAEQLRQELQDLLDAKLVQFRQEFSEEWGSQATAGARSFPLPTGLSSLPPTGSGAGQEPLDPELIKMTITLGAFMRTHRAEQGDQMARAEARLRQGIKEGDVPALSIPYGTTVQPRLTDEQQDAALRYVRAYGFALQNCSSCPHGKKGGASS